MKIRVLPFGQIVEVTGKEPFYVVASDTQEMRTTLIRTFPLLSKKTFAIAVNKQLITTNTPLTPNAEVALLPPFSGG